MTRYRAKTYTINGITDTIPGWTDRVNGEGIEISEHTVRWRISQGMSIEDALFTRTTRSKNNEPTLTSEYLKEQWARFYRKPKQPKQEPRYIFKMITSSGGCYVENPRYKNGRKGISKST